MGIAFVSSRESEFWPEEEHLKYTITSGILYFIICNEKLRNHASVVLPFSWWVLFTNKT